MNRKSIEQKMENPLLVVETQNYCKLALATSCKHCSVESYAEKESKTDSDVDWINVVEQFAKIGKDGHVIVKNGAGALGDTEISILEKALTKGLSISITTEGVCVPKGFESKLYELEKNHVGKVGVTVSLEGATKEIYGQLRKPEHFERAVDFMKRAKLKGLTVATNYVVHAGNVSSIQDYVNFAVNELGVEKVNFLELHSTGNARKNKLEVADSQKYFDELMRTYREGDDKVKDALEGTFAAEVYRAENGLSQGNNGCPAGSRGMYFIQHSGEVFPCSSLELPQYHVGNIKAMNLEEVNQSMEFGYARKVAQSLKSGNPLVSMCPGMLESFGEEGRMQEAEKMTAIITNYLKEKGVELTKDKNCNNCYSPAF